MPGGRPRKFPRDWSKAQIAHAEYIARRDRERKFREAETKFPELMLEVNAGLRQVIRDMGSAALRRVYRAHLRLASRGNMSAIRELYDRLAGRPGQSITVKQDRSDALALEQLDSMPPAVAIHQLELAISKLSSLRDRFAKALPPAESVTVEVQDVSRETLSDVQEAAPKQEQQTVIGEPDGCVNSSVIDSALCTRIDVTDR